MSGSAEKMAEFVLYFPCSAGALALLSHALNVHNVHNAHDSQEEIRAVLISPSALLSAPIESLQVWQGPDLMHGSFRWPACHRSCPPGLNHNRISPFILSDFGSPSALLIITSLHRSHSSCNSSMIDLRPCSMP